MMEKLIKLIDGREVTVYPKDVQKADGVAEDKFGLDTTGQYLSIGNKKFIRPSQTIMERGMTRYKVRLFINNAWFLLENAETILSDSRMFLTPVSVRSGLAYFGEGGFKNPTVGVYLEWWLNHKEASITPDGSLIWYIAGSPLSGMHSCSSVSPDGKTHTETTLRPFSKVWRSFIDVNKRYTEVKQVCEAYSLEELLVRLRGDDYAKEISGLRQECIDLSALYNNKPDWPADATQQKKVVKASRRQKLLTIEKEILSFYDTFTKREVDMEKAQREGDITAYRARLHELADFSTEFVESTFGENPLDICLTDVIKFAKSKKL